MTQPRILQLLYKQIALFVILTQFIMPSHANTLEKRQEAKITINKLYRELARTPNLSMPDRLDQISAAFLGKPYLLGALGEGAQGQYDQSPRYRIDGFDCETFVDTVLGIALTNEFNQFEQCIDKIRYKNGQVDFLMRNHFTDLDWNHNNQQQKILQDITMRIKNTSNESVTKIATTIINKPAWYEHFNINQIKRSSATLKEKNQRLIELKTKGKQLPIRISNIPYIPLKVLFNSEGKANETLFKQIPNGAIIEIIRPNWNLKDNIGTCLNVSHLGFAFWHHGKLIFRQASSEYHQVVDVPLIDYLKKALSSPTIGGINIQLVLDRQVEHLKDC